MVYYNNETIKNEMEDCLRVYKNINGRFLLAHLFKDEKTVEFYEYKYLEKKMGNCVEKSVFFWKRIMTKMMRRYCFL